MPTVQEFLETLLPDLRDSFVEARLINGKETWRHFYDSVGAFVHAAPKTLQEQGRFNVFFGVNPRYQVAGQAAPTGKKDSVKRVWSLWSDMDAKSFGGDKQITLDRLRQFACFPTAVVDSGHGTHGYWRLREPIEIAAPEDVTRIERYLKALARALNADPAAAELARVMRLPETWNLKDPTAPVLASILDFDPTRQYNLSDFDFLLGKAAAEGTPQGNPAGWFAQALQDLREGRRDDCHNVFGKLIGKIISGTVDADDLVALLAPHLEQVSHQGHGFSHQDLLELADDMRSRYRRTFTTSQLYKEDEAVKFAPVLLERAGEPESRVDIVEGLVPEGYPTLVYGEGGQGKSALALALAVCVATGTPFLGRHVRQTNVLYLDWELDRNEMTRRAYQIARGLGLAHPPSNLWYQRVEQPLSKLLTSVKSWIEAHAIGLVVMDSLGLACADDPELARVVIPLFSKLRNLHTTVFALDHQAKLQEGQHYHRKTPFGSVYKYNLARSVIQVEKVTEEQDGLALRLHQAKFNFGRRSDNIGVRLTFDADATRLTLDQTTERAFQETLAAQDKVLACLRQEGVATNEKLAQRTGMNQRTVENTMSKLHSAGRVRVVGKTGHAIVWATGYSLCVWTPEDGVEIDESAEMQVTRA